MFRYDSLIQDHRPKMHGHAQETHAVGCNLAWEQLYISMSKYNRGLIGAAASKHAAEDEHHITGAWATRRCDVIVSAFDSVALRSSGISLLQELWANGIRAELGKNITGMESLVHQYKHDGASWVVTVKQGLISGERSLKVKNLHTKQDVDLKNSELVSWLKTELAERDRLRNAPARLSRHFSADMVPRAPGEETHVDMEVRIWASERKGRKVNRAAIIEAAQRSAAEVSAAYLKCPAVAVDVRGDLLEQILRVHSAEGWKKLAQNLPATERNYVLDIQKHLDELKAEGHKEAWVYSFRTGGTGIVRLT
jgi:translation initiation factor 2-alpha kinase 4